MIRQVSMNLWLLLGATLFLLVHHQANATLHEKLLLRRQSADDQGATITSDQETVTKSSAVDGQGQQNGGPTRIPSRLYPDLPQPPTHGGPTPYLPFGMQMPPRGFNSPQILMPQQPRPMTPAERQQSQTFTQGLGRRLLSMIGIENKSDETDPANEPQAGRQMTRSMGDDATMRALQNSTVVQHLNRGVSSIYDNLAKMYNSTVQQQLAILQERFQKVSENNTNPWQQRMAQQVPMFFKSMASKVEDAQANLNRVLQQVMKAQNQSSSAPVTENSQRLQSRNMFDQFMPYDEGPYAPAAQQGGNFFQQIGHSLGFGRNGEQFPSAVGGRQDFGSMLMDFWHNQVQPQMGMIHGQVMRIWRDLTSSGAFSPHMMVQSRQASNNVGSTDSGNTSEIVDDILKSVDMNGPDYTLVDPKQGSTPSSNINPQIQNGIMNMQREINQLWMGLTNSLQGAIGNVKRILNPPRPGQTEPMESNPEENEIGSKISDLSKLQREADTVYDVVRKQQEAQQRQGFGDRFRNFFNNMDLSGVERLPDRIGHSISRFGTVINDLWHQAPGRWDNFMQNSRNDNNNNNNNNNQDNMMMNSKLTVQDGGSSSTTQQVPLMNSKRS